MTLPTLDHRFATEKLIADFETKPTTVDHLEKELGSRLLAMKHLAESAAPSFVQAESTVFPGQISHVLSGWHRYLAGETSDLYRTLHKDPGGPQLAREEANTVPELVTLQAIRRGVRAAARHQGRLAAGTIKR